jgi:hypothetical protein
MTSLISEPFNLPQGKLIQARVLADNDILASVPSILNSFGDLVEYVPHKPPIAPVKNALTTQTSLVIDTQHLVGTANGGSEVLAYLVEWDQGTGNWIQIQDSLLNQVTVDSSITPGSIYGFRYRARNRQGTGAYSDVTKVMATNVPDQMLPAQTELQGTDVKVSWQEPNSGTLSIEYYLVEFLTNDGVTYRQAPTCNG